MKETKRANPLNLEGLLLMSTFTKKTDPFGLPPGKGGIKGIQVPAAAQYSVHVDGRIKKKEKTGKILGCHPPEISGKAPRRGGELKLIFGALS